MDQRVALGEQREKARLDARTRETDKARTDADAARGEAAVALSQADAARSDADAARQATADLKKQMEELNAKTTERGEVVTLGDVLFDTGQSSLRGGSAGKLDKLAAFLTKYQDHTAAIEGHTDSVGSEEMNRDLSQRRADAVKAYLVSRGVSSARIVTQGMGEGHPVAVNDSASGRQQNRRVEVIIANKVTSL